MMKYVTALLPSIGVLGIFWVAIRAMIQADRRERIAQARIELARQAEDADQEHRQQPADAEDAAHPGEGRTA